MTYRVIVTGSRDYSDFEMVDAMLYNAWLDNVGPKSKDKIVVVTTNAVGAARLAGKSASENGDVTILEVHAPDYSIKGNAQTAEIDNNREMLDAGADLVLAFGKPDPISVHLVTEAQALGIPVRGYP